MIIQFAKGGGSLQIHHHKVLRSRVYIQKKRFCVIGAVFEVLLTIVSELNLNRKQASNCQQKKRYSAI